MAIATAAALGAGISSIGAIAGGIGGIAGAIGGAQGKRENRTGMENASSTSGINLGPASQLEQQSAANLQSNFSQLEQFANLGPGGADVSAGVGASRDLASLLQQYQQTGGAPSSQDILQGNQFASTQFAGQRLGAQQAALEASQQFAQQAAIQGRGGLDPVFRNKVAQQQQQQEAIIGAQQNAFGAQQAQQMSQNRLGFAAQRANVLGGLATQALSNRQALVGMGSQIQSAERNFRLASGQKYDTKSGSSGASTENPGGILGAISGGFGGLAAGVQGVSGLQKLFANAPQQDITQRPDIISGKGTWGGT